MVVGLGKSFASEFTLTFVLIFFIFFFSFPDFGKLLKVNDSFSFAPMVTGFVLMFLIFISIFIMIKSGFTILSGHMSPIYTMFCMISNAIFKDGAIYSTGITPTVGFTLIGAQVAGTLMAFTVLFIIFKFASKKKTE